MSQHKLFSGIDIGGFYLPFMIFAGAMMLIAFIAFGIDKYCAVNHKWRIRESVLYLLSLLFGATGSALGMMIFRHKTRKTGFRILIPLLAAVQIAFIVWLSIGYFS